MTTEELRKINDDFNERLRVIFIEGNEDFNPLDIGQPCDMLLNAGLPNLPLQVSVQRIIDKKLQKNHPFKVISIVDMPEYLTQPIAVFKSKTIPDRKVILTDMEEKGIHFVVVIEANRQAGKQFVNSIRSVYPKDNVMDILLWIAQDKLLETCNKEKILDWIGKQQSNSADVTNLIEDCTKIINSI